MPVVFVDGQSHYTTAAQGRDKYAYTLNAPSAGTGAHGAPGIAGDQNAVGAQYNFAGSVEREFSLYLDTPSLGEPRNLWALFDNNFPQLWADVQTDGSIKIWNGVMAGGAFSAYGTRDTLLGTVPAGSLQFNVNNIHKVSVLHDGTTGTLEYKLNGVTVLTLSNVNTAPSGNDQSTILYIGYRSILPGIVGSSDSIRSHVIIADAIGDIVGNPRLGALFPDGVGNSSDWTPLAGDNWENVEETTPDDDSSYVESDTVGHVDTYSMEDTASDATISAVAVTARIKKTDANSRTVAAVLRISGTDYVHPAAKGVPGDYAYLQWIWTENPATLAPFTPAEVNAIEAGIKVIS
jgi:hypothetical protein